MKYTIKHTSVFKKDLKRMEKQHKNISLLSDVIKMLADGEELPERYRDHALNGKYIGCRECHIQPDWLLVYQIDGEELYLYLMQTGSHSDIF